MTPEIPQTAEWTERLELVAIETIEQGDLGRFVDYSGAMPRVVMARAHRDLDIGERVIVAAE